MEFTRLADVEVVETANDIDKVLIEQNGEIKRVPKTEVGGSGGNTLVMQFDFDMNNFTVTSYTSNMTFDEALAAMNARELTGCFVYFLADTTMHAPAIIVDGTADMGVPAIIFAVIMPTGEMFQVPWTADGI